MKGRMPKIPSSASVGASSSQPTLFDRIRPSPAKAVGRGTRPRPAVVSGLLAVAEVGQFCFGLGGHLVEAGVRIHGAGQDLVERRGRRLQDLGWNG